MSKIAYLVRHGQHIGNVLTPAGVARMQAAAEAIKADLVGHRLDVGNVCVYSSQEPRAVMSAGVIAAALGIKVTGGQLEDFNPAAGLGKAIQEKRLPDVGQGFVRAWIDKGCDGVEDFTVVHTRSSLTLGKLMAEATIPIVATHGGVIEPCVKFDAGADDHDFVEGEVAIVEFDEVGVLVYFLNAKLPE